MKETALKKILEAVFGKKCNCAHFDTKSCPWFHETIFLLKSTYTARTQEDPDIQILLDHAKDLYSALLRGKTTLADNTCYAILIKLERATEKRRHELVLADALAGSVR
ncbi:hypothetical protein DPMN_112539 [Dreissena polymorpha]|uniref:Uncharacterized protein n=1 Tax=Dreissena polymorpha TaxID=45954 RepID=A0A9D4QPU7_DREPO|nr:hypothetical protein DPMN_112539 [Dreissena polymorpha]